VTFDPGNRNRLSPRDLPRFPGGSLFARVARVVCEADCLARKELYEAWEVARRVRRRLRGGRVLDLACGHGLLAHLLLLLDDTSPTALAVDPRLPRTAATLAAALARAWPRLAGRVTFVSGPLGDVATAPGDLAASVHACGPLTDEVIALALGARARLAVLPCCHDARAGDAGGLGGWLDAPLAIDATRVARVRAAGYAVLTQLIPAAITPRNRLLLAWPEASTPPGGG
jgi:hypothetical protein